MSTVHMYDDYEVLTRDLTRMETEINALHNASKWMVVPKTNEVHMIGFEQVDMYAQNPARPEAYETLRKVDPDLATDTATGGTNLILKMGEYTSLQFLVRNCAMPSLYESADISGSALGRMNPDLLSDTLNNAFSTARGASTALIRCGKLTALLSPSYIIMDTKEVMDTARERLAQRLGTLEFVEGYNSHSYTSMLFALPDKEQELMTHYIGAMGSAQQYRGANYMPAIRVSTSDTGFSAATLLPLYRDSSNGRTNYYTFVDPVKVEHRSRGVKAKQGIEAWIEACDNVMSAFNEAEEKIKKMAETTVQYPINVISGCCKRVGIPVKYIRNAVDAHMVYGDSACSMYDCYLSIYDGFADVDEWKTRMDLEEKTRKILNINWLEYDSLFKD